MQLKSIQFFFFGGGNFDIEKLQLLMYRPAIQIVILAKFYGHCGPSATVKVSGDCTVNTVYPFFFI